MPATAANTFFLTLKKSNLLTNKQFAGVRGAAQRAGIADDPQALAQALVKRMLITSWQAEQVLAGHEAFFLGKYKLLERIGTGGMGAVFKAQHSTIGRIVALKVVSKDRLDRADAVARFHREIQAAAMLQHPNIITALDADSVGETHFLVMEFSEGRDLNVWFKQYGPLPLKWACEVGRQAALGLQHAHERGMVHRDIKPANIMVTQDPDTGRPTAKILDMGLARFISEAKVAGDLTESGQILGTPDYIAPEQAKNTRKADIRADIFSLGCTLFRVLTGSLPFDGENPVEKLVARYTTDAPPLRSLRPDAPAQLEAIVARMMARDPKQRFQTPAEVVRAIAPYSYEADSGAEPATVGAAPSGLSIHSNHEPEELSSQTGEFLNLLSEQAERETPSLSSETLASTSGAPFPARMLGENHARRSPWAPFAAGACGALVAGLVLWIVSSFFGGPPPDGSLVLNWPVHLREQADLTVDGKSVDLAKFSDPQRVVIRGAAGTHTIRVTRPDFVGIEKTVQLGSGESKPISFNWQVHPDVKRQREWTLLSQQANALLGQPANPSRYEYIAQMRLKLETFASTHAPSRESQLARAVAERLPREPAARPQLPAGIEQYAGDAPVVGVLGDLALRHAGAISALAFSPDGQLLATAGTDFQTKVWDAGTYELRYTVDRAGMVYGLEFSGDGKQLATLGRPTRPGDPSIKLWNAANGQPLAPLTLHPSSVCFDVGGQILASGRIDGKVSLYNLDSGQERLFKVSSGTVLSVAISRDGQRLAAITTEGLQLWKAPFTNRSEMLEALSMTVNMGLRALEFSPDGKQLAAISRSESAAARIYDTETGAPLYEFHSPGNPVTRVAFSPQGNRLALVSQRGGMIQVVNLTAGQLDFSMPTSHGYVANIDFRPPTGDLLAVADGAGVRMVNLKNQRDAFERTGHDNGITAVSFMGDGRQLASVGQDQRLIVWDTAKRTPVREQSLAAPASEAAFSPTGEAVVMPTTDRQLIAYQTSGDAPRSLKAQTQFPTAMAFSPDGIWFAASSVDPTGRRSGVGIWGMGDWEQTQTLAIPAGRLLALALSSNGRLATLQRDNTGPLAGRAPRIQQWDVLSGHPVGQPLSVPNNTMSLLGYSKNDSRLLIGTVNQLISIDAKDGRPKWTCNTPSVPRTMAVSPADPNRLAVYTLAAQVLLVDARTGEITDQFDLGTTTREGMLMSVTRGSATQELSFNRDGTLLAVGHSTGTVLLLDVSRSADTQAFDR